jgi:hypothetical protein
MWTRSVARVREVAQLSSGTMGWREHRRKRVTQLADEYQYESTASWRVGAVLAVVLGGGALGGALYLLEWAVQGERHLLRSFSTSTLSVLGYECGGRYLGWRAHSRRTRQPDQSATA